MKKILTIFLILLVLPIFTAIKVENLSRLIDPIPLGVPISFTTKVTNTGETATEYVVYVQTPEEARIKPSSERTPYLRQYQCLDCGATFIEDEMKIHTCPECGSKNIKEGNRIYAGLEGKEDYFKKITSIPDTKFIRVNPDRFFLKPDESIELQITVNIPHNSKYFDKFYEAIISIEPSLPEKQTANIVRRIEMDTDEISHDYFTFRVDGNPDERYMITSSDIRYTAPIDVLSVKIQLDGEWYDVYPTPKLYKGNKLFLLKYDKMYSMQMTYKPVENNRKTEVSIYINYMKYLKYQTGVAGRLWIKTAKNEEQNNRLIESGKIKVIDPETEVPENTQTPTKTTAPPTIYVTPPAQNNNKDLWYIIAGVLFVLFLAGVYILI